MPDYELVLSLLLKSGFTLCLRLYIAVFIYKNMYQFCYIHSVTILSCIVRIKPKHCPILHPASPSSFLAEVGRSV